MLEKVYGSKNRANMLTKGVTLDKLKLYKTSVGLQEEKMDIAPFVSKWKIVMYGHKMVVGCHVKHELHGKGQK